MIAATNRDLKEEADQKRFRADLYYRLNVVRLQIPPLRERVEDVEPIAKHLLGDINRRQKRRVLGFEREALDKLRAHRWPGNVRELRNVIESAVIQTERDWIGGEMIVLDRDSSPRGEINGMLNLPYREAIAEFDKRYFGRLLERTAGNKSEAADAAGIDRTTLYKHLEKAGVGGT
jgi:DNA-binding NtrC family response regulator